MRKLQNSFKVFFGSDHFSRILINELDQVMTEMVNKGIYHNLSCIGGFAYVKIGYFGNSDSDLQYQDEVHGPLIEQADHTVELVYTKYLKALIDYDGIQRTERDDD